MKTLEACTPTEAVTVEEILHLIASDVALLVDHDVTIGAVETERVDRRPVGADRIHISFRFVIEHGGQGAEGCLLLPLPESLSLAKYLMMVDDGEVAERREDQDLERGDKDAMLELSKHVATAVDGALSDHHPGTFQVRSDGCQGVRADVRPALDYAEGDALLVGRARATIHEFPEFEAILILPDLPLD